MALNALLTLKALLAETLLCANNPLALLMPFVTIHVADFWRFIAGYSAYGLK